MKYLSYYGLEKDPFQKEIKTEELYESLEFKQGLSRLEYLKEIKGIGLIDKANELAVYASQHLN